jgi:hypothetical protein
MCPWRQNIPIRRPIAYDTRRISLPPWHQRKPVRRDFFSKSGSLLNRCQENGYSKKVPGGIYAEIQNHATLSV